MQTLLFNGDVVVLGWKKRTGLIRLRPAISFFQGLASSFEKSETLEEKGEAFGIFAK
jgi:hypothetical protein